MPYPYIYSNGYITGALSHLPLNIQKAAESLDIAAEVVAIGDTHGLLLSEIGDIFDIVRDTLAGQISVKDFARILKTKLGSDHEEEAESITDELNQKIFLKLRELLQNSAQKTDTSSSNSQAFPDLSTRRRQPYSSVGNVTPRKPLIQEKPSFSPPSPPAQPPKIQTPVPKPDVPDRKKLLEEIENPQNLASKAPPPPNLPTESSAPIMGKYGQVTKPESAEVIIPPAPKKVKTEWKIKPRGSREESIQPSIEQRPTANTETVQGSSHYTVDPYREPIE